MKRSTGLWTAGALIFAIVIGVFSVYSYNLNTRAGQEAQRPVTDLPIEGEGEIPASKRSKSFSDPKLMPRLPLRWKKTLKLLR